jgi:hypothetical protein
MDFAPSLQAEIAAANSSGKVVYACRVIVDQAALKRYLNSASSDGNAVKITSLSTLAETSRRTLKMQVRNRNLPNPESLANRPDEAAQRSANAGVVWE